MEYWSSASLVGGDRWHPLDCTTSEDSERNFHIQTALGSLEDVLKYLVMVQVLTTIQQSTHQVQMKVCFALKVVKVQTSWEQWMVLHDEGWGEDKG